MSKMKMRSGFEFGPREHADALGRVRALIGIVAISLLFGAMTAGAEAGSAPALVDVNRASAEELATLPGIGEAKAAAIVAHRESSGAFVSIDQLQDVRGIGPALATKLRPHVTLGSRGPSKAGSKAAEAAVE
jgi:competence protein ComEA